LAADHVLGVLNFGTPGVDATYPYLKAQGVPDFILFAGVTNFKPLAKSAHLVFSSYSQQGAAIGQYVAKNYPGQSVAVLYQDDDLGSGYLSGFKRFDTHVSVAETYDPSDSDFSSQINAMRASGSKIAACFCLSGQVVQLVQLGQSTGWNPTVVTESSNAGPSLVSAVGASLADGVISMSFFPNTSGPGKSAQTAALIKDMQSENATVPVTSFTEVSAALSELIVSALSPLQGTITRADVVNALADVHATGGWYGTTNTSGESEQPGLFSCWTFDVIKAGLTVPVGPVTCGDQLPKR
jgi:ABC-type branched-subunit amino acid transport system substrate-binding protein